MKIVKSHLLSLIPITVLACKHTEEGAALKVSPPANMERIVRCDLGNHPDGVTASFNGKPIRYMNSSEIPYDSPSWHSTANAPWLSYEAFNSGNIGEPGYAGSSREAVAPNGISNVRLAVVDVRMVDGKPYYHYFTNETGLNPIENWSSTKSLVMTMAASSLRKASGGAVGLWSQTAGDTWVGTHVTEVARTSDNGTAVWFKSITGGRESHRLFHDWLAKGDPSQSFAGGHGSPARNLGSTFTVENGSSVTIPKAGQFVSAGINTVKPIVMAEFWKRLAVNSNDPSLWLGEITDDDLTVLKYGYKSGHSNGGLLYGATKNDSFISSFGGPTRLNAISSRWRVFGKTGSGYSNSRGRHEAAIGGYLCIPQSNSAGIKGGKLMAFFMNVQAESTAKKYQIRNAVMAKITNLMVPEIRGADSVWTPLAKATSISPRVTTFFKINQGQSSSLTDGTQRCTLQAGEDYELAEPTSLSASGHTQITLQNAPAGCDFQSGYVYTPHF